MMPFTDARSASAKQVKKYSHFRAVIASAFDINLANMFWYAQRTDNCIPGDQWAEKLQPSNKEQKKRESGRAGQDRAVKERREHRGGTAVVSAYIYIY